MYLPGILIRFILSWCQENVTFASQCRRVCKDWRDALSSEVIARDGGLSAVHLAMGREFVGGAQQLPRFFGAYTDTLSACGTRETHRRHHDKLLACLDASQARITTFNFLSSPSIEEQVFTQFLARMPHLTKLYINMCASGDGPTYIYMVECLKLTPNLEHLAIRGASIGNDGVLRIVNACPHLVTLDVSGTPYITYQFVDDVVRSGSRLKVIDVSSCNWISINDVSELRQRHKGLTIIDKLRPRRPNGEPGDEIV